MLWSALCSKKRAVCLQQSMLWAVFTHASLLSEDPILPTVAGNIFSYTGHSVHKITVMGKLQSIIVTNDAATHLPTQSILMRSACSSKWSDIKTSQYVRNVCPQLLEKCSFHINRPVECIAYLSGVFGNNVTASFSVTVKIISSNDYFKSAF